VARTGSMSRPALVLICTLRTGGPIAGLSAKATLIRLRSIVVSNLILIHCPTGPDLLPDFHIVLRFPSTAANGR